MNHADRSMVIEGTFIEHADDPHVQFRCELLASGAVLPEPDIAILTSNLLNLPKLVDGVIRSQLQERGLAIIQTDRPLCTEEFILIGQMLGRVTPETDPVVQPYVEKEVVLNLVSEYEDTHDVSRQPFANNFLTLHTESSGRAVEEQPRYLVLDCCDPGDSSSAAQTVLVPMDTVVHELPTTIRAELSRTRYRQSHRCPPILRQVDGRSIFSFRDFYSAALDWSSSDPTDHESVNESIRKLLLTMYGCKAAAGIHWRRGLIAIIDNTFYFHGRTAGRPAVTKRRHLRRLRIR